MTGALLTVGAMVVLAIVVLAAFRWRYSIVTVRGQRMEPALLDGDRVLVQRCGVGKLRTGQLVVFREPDPDGLLLRRLPVRLTGANQENWIIKRVAAVPGEPVPQVASKAVGHTLVVPPRSIVVLGDAYASCDSRLWGLIPASDILGTGTRRPGAKVPGQVQSSRQRAYPRGSQ
jgi:signal peptidase I